MVFILILDHENVGLNAFVISLSYIISEILHKVNFSIMVEDNLHIGNIYTCIYIDINIFMLQLSSGVYLNP